MGAEAVALSGNVDRLLWLRILWQWLNNPSIEWQSPEKVLHEARQAALVTDCKSAYDLLTRTAVPQCEEHRTTIECLLIRERLQANCVVRWVTSNAQLADCLTKSMDASVLRQCLKSGRYSLFDENRVLQQRSDKRQRLKWAKEVASKSPENETVLKCTEEVRQDTWEQDSSGQVIRVHHVPRYQLFSPVGILDCPVDLRTLGLERVTRGCDSNGHRWYNKDFWPGTRGHAKMSNLWTGKTIFKVRGV